MENFSRKLDRLVQGKSDVICRGEGQKNSLFDMDFGDYSTTNPCGSGI